MLYLAAAMYFIMDGMTPFMNAHSQAIWQTQTPRELQGRVFAVRTMIAWVTIPLSTVWPVGPAARLDPAWSSP